MRQGPVGYTGGAKNTYNVQWFMSDEFFIFLVRERVGEDLDFSHFELYGITLCTRAGLTKDSEEKCLIGEICSAGETAFEDSEEG